MTARKLTLEETLDAAVLGGEIDEVVRETAAMTDAEIEADLRGDEVDLEDLDARLAKMAGRLFPPAKRARKPLVFGAGFVSGGAVVGAIVRAASVAAPAQHAACPRRRLMIAVARPAAGRSRPRTRRGAPRQARRGEEARP